MIKHITGSVTFNTPPITLAVDYQPQTGITAVVGPNGSGKSFAVIELVRYLLYGKAALRGKASDYKTLWAKGIFVIRNKEYVIERGKRDQIVERYQPEILAVGPDAVTEHVTQLMGYGLSVFDIANASVQKKADNFGSMRPAERKRLIDRVVGMTSLEVAEKACRDEAKILRREAEALERQMPVVVPFSEPYANQPADKLAAELQRAEAYDLVQRRLRPAERPEAPSGQLPTAEALMALEGHQQAFLQAARDRTRLEGQLVSLKDRRGVHPVELDRAEERLRVAHIIEKRGEPPQLPASESERYWAQHAVFDAYKPSPEIECPNCQHHFHVTGERPPEPRYSKSFLRVDDAQRAKHAEPAPELPEGYDMTAAEIAADRKFWVDVQTNATVGAELMALPQLEDRSAELAAVRRDQAQWAAYSVLNHAYEQIVQANADVQDELDRLEEPTQSIEMLRSLLGAAQASEAARAAHEHSVARRDEFAKQIAEALRLAEQYTAGAAGVSDARTEVKAFLTPALSRAASRLVHDMTHGKLESVVVDEDMEITVNGQRIETLSGGGETVANIALRIALGQVLVKDTFPVFIGDEMDADADDERREAVLQSMVSLKEHLDQIIIVTHRSIEVADHVIDMKDTE